jgi:hypothetical protein
MAVHGDQPLAVVDQHGVAIEEEITGLDHCARRGRLYRGACSGGNVETAVRIARLLVEKTPQSERAAGWAGHRFVKFHDYVVLV